MRISVDAGLCTGHGRCYAVGPEAYGPDDEGYCADRGRDREVPAEFEAAALAGARACPEGAITILPVEGDTMNPVAAGSAEPVCLPVTQEELRWLIDRQHIADLLEIGRAHV